MPSLKTLLLSATTAAAIPLTIPSVSPRGTSTGNGHSNGFFYSFWTDGVGDVNYLNGPDGSYTVSWRNCSNFFGGKGWNPGSTDRNISFSGTFNPNGNGYLSIYGFAKDPLVEYYVVEAYGNYNPAQQFTAGHGSSQSKEGGMLEVDGGRYTIGLNRMVRMTTGPDAVLTTVWSVREAGDRREAGTVNMKAHFDAWRERLGVKIGTMDYQIVATEGYKSSGIAEITVDKSA